MNVSPVHDTLDTLTCNSEQLLKLMGRRIAMDLPKVKPTAHARDD